MKQQLSPTEPPDSLLCRIRAVGHVSDAAIVYWTGLRVNTLPLRNNRPESEVHGYLPDQSALIGVVNHLYNLGYAILFVECDSTQRAAGASST